MVKVIWSFSNRERGYLLTIYININIYIIVADFDSVFSILTNDQMTTPPKKNNPRKRIIFFRKHS